MNSFRRWTIGFCAKFDELLGQVENHEALATQALQDMRTSLARARGQLARVERDCKKLEGEERAAQLNAKKWRERASLESDDTRAMECLKRSRSAAKTAGELHGRVSEQRQMRDQVQGTIRGLEQKYLDLKNKRQLLSTRQAAAQASEAVYQESGNSVELEDVFSRWEVKLTEREFVPGEVEFSPDQFADEYDSQEEQESLLEELKALRAGNDAAQEGAQS